MKPRTLRYRQVIALKYLKKKLSYLIEFDEAVNIGPHTEILKCFTFFKSLNMIEIKIIAIV